MFSENKWQKPKFLLDKTLDEKKQKELLLERAEEIRNLGRQYGLSCNRIEQCFQRVFKDISTKENSTKTSSKCLTTLLFILLFLLSSYWMLACYKPTQTLVSRNIQPLIYPCMRALRLATLWMHQKFQGLSSWHEEQCLIANPWYKNVDLNCWPCQQIPAVTNLTLLPNYIHTYLLHGLPFVVKDDCALPFTLEMLEKLYVQYENELTSATGYFRSNVPSLKDAKDIFETGKSQKLYEYNKIHIEWQLKRCSAARVMRTIFPRPQFVPNNTEVALERYLFIDGPSSLPYNIPLTEFANVWLHQRVGRRVVTFQPSPHCRDNCSSVSTVIFGGDILFYNWQYWRLQFLPSATSLSVTYMGSFY